MPLAGGMVLSIANLPRPCWARRCKARSGLVSEQPSGANAAAISLVRMSASRCSARVLVRSNWWSMWLGIISPTSGLGWLPKAGHFALRESERATGERRGAVDGGGALRCNLLKPVGTGGAKLWGDGHLGRGQAHVGSNGVDRDRQAS